MNSKGHLICGRSNEIALSQRGAYQAGLLGKRLARSGVVFDDVYSSSAKRSLETARIVGTHICFSLDEVISTADLLELDQGDWEGKPRADIYSPELVAEINRDNWNFTPPNGESQKIVEQRMLRWVNDTLVSRHSQEKTVGVFTHGFAIKCLLRGILDFSASHTYKIRIENTALTRLTYNDQGWHLMTVNDTAHLLED